jgi:hypothetical protein
MQLRSGVALIALAGLLVLALAPNANTGGISTTTFPVQNDSANVSLTTFFIWDSAGVGASADFDTSIVYDSRYWDDITVGLKSRPGCQPCLAVAAAAGDSGAVVVVLQQSNDGIYWTPIDSITAADSLPVFKDMTPQKYAFSRFVAHHGAKTDSSGTKAIVTIRPWGQY